MHITSFSVPFNSVKCIHVVVQLVSVKQLSISPSLRPLASTCYLLFLWVWPSKRSSECILENGAANLQTKILILIHPMTGAPFKVSILENHVLIFMILHCLIYFETVINVCDMFIFQKWQISILWGQIKVLETSKSYFIQVSG